MTEEQQRLERASRAAWAWMEDGRRSNGTAVYWFCFALLGIATGAVVIALAGLR